MRSKRAIANLKTFCETARCGGSLRFSDCRGGDRELPQSVNIEVIDVTKSPEIAEAKKILITPTLIKESPKPEERIIGDLSNTEVLAFVLGLPFKSIPPQI